LPSSLRPQTESPTTDERPVAMWKIAVLCLIGFAFLLGALSVWSPELMQDAWAGHNDFVPSYIAGRLASSGELYSPETQRRLQVELLGIRNDNMLYMRPPFFAVLMKPLAVLPFRASYTIFQIISVVSIAIFVWIFAKRSIDVAVLASISLPILLAVLQGQDIGIVVLAYAGFYLFSERGQGYRGGLALSLCLIKFHLFPLTAIALLIRREWDVVRGVLVGGILFLGLSFAVVGSGWPSMYLETVRNPALNPGVKVMPNLHGLVAQMEWNGAMEWILVFVVIVGFVVAVVRGMRRPMTYALALTGGLLLSFHAYSQDAMLLLAALGILARSEGVEVMKRLLQISLTPIPYALLSLQNRLSGTLTALTLAAFGAGLWYASASARRMRSSSEPGR